MERTDMVDNSWFIGQSIGVFYGIQGNGLWQDTPEDQAEMAKFNENGHNFTPGSVRPVDQDGNYVIDDDDRVILGNKNPKWTMGWTNNFSAEYTHLDNYQYKKDDASKNNADLGLYKTGFIEAWNDGVDFTGTLTYTLNELPNGHYKISAYTFTSENGKTSFTANDKEVALDNTTNLYTQPVIDDVIVDEHKLTFGLNIGGANWIGITNNPVAITSPN